MTNIRKRSIVSRHSVTFMSFFLLIRQLESELVGTLRKQQTTPERSERRGNLSREEEKMENRSESGRDMVKHRSQVGFSLCLYAS